MSELRSNHIVRPFFNESIQNGAHLKGTRGPLPGARKRCNLARDALVIFVMGPLGPFLFLQYMQIKYARDAQHTLATCDK